MLSIGSHRHSVPGPGNNFTATLSGRLNKNKEVKQLLLCPTHAKSSVPFLSAEFFLKFLDTGLLSRAPPAAD